MEFSRKFVCATHEYTTYENHVPAPLFRRAFNLDKMPEKAEILISGLGFYDLYINGEKITKGLLAPYISNTDDWVYYDLYDLVPYLQVGENVIGVMLGCGMQNPVSTIWDFDKAIYMSSPKLAFSFRAECGEDILEFDATDCVCSESAMTFNSLRCGVFYDARLEQDGWNDVGFDDSAWKPVLRAENPRGKAKICEAEPILVHREIKPVSVKPGKMEPEKLRRDMQATEDAIQVVPAPCDYEGGYVYDFGVNIAGIFRLKIKGKPGQKVSVYCAEIGSETYVNSNNISFFFPRGYGQRDIYICKGDEEEIWEPQFTYHGYRYLYVTGIDAEQATEDLLTCEVIYSDMTMLSDFRCSDEIANKLWEIGMRADLSNFVYFPTDCPHREKNGWTGDAAVSAEHMLLKFDASVSYREWMNNIRASQAENGAISGIIPTTGWGFEWGNGPVFDRIIVYLPYYTYIYRGETEMIEENAHMIMRYLEYASRKRDDFGLLAYGLGDWVPVGRGAGTAPTPLRVVSTVMTMDMCYKAEFLFRAVGLDLQADFAAQFGDELREAFRGELIDFCTMTVEGNSQSAQALALHYGIFEPGEQAEAFRRLVEFVEDQNFHVDSGFVGLRVIFHVLSDFGRADLAYKMMMQDDYPSYKGWILRGETAMVEQFMPDGADCGSHNHHFLGDVTHWFQRNLLGLNVNPHGDDPDEVTVHPHFLDEISFAEGYYDLPSGRISVSWKREDDKIRLSVKADHGVKCHIQLDRPYWFEDKKWAHRDDCGEWLLIKNVK